MGGSEFDGQNNVDACIDVGWNRIPVLSEDERRREGNLIMEMKKPKAGVCERHKDGETLIER